MSSIAAARQEVQTLFEMALDLGNSLSLPETLSVLAMRLKQLVHFDTFAIYVLRNHKLIPEYVAGEDRALFSSLEIPLGQGLSGWVADNRKPIVNGNPSVEPGYLNDPSKFSKLGSALSVPLEDCCGRGGCADVVPQRAQCLQPGSIANRAGHHMQAGCGAPERAHISSGPRFGHYRLSHRTSQYRAPSSYTWIASFRVARELRKLSP